MRRLLSILKGLLLGLFAIAPKPALGGGPTRAVIVVYDGWGDPTGFSIAGRVLEDQGVRAPDGNGKESANLVDNLKALESDEIEGITVKVTVQGVSYSAVTDDDGVFRIAVQGLRGDAALPLGPQAAHAELVSAPDVNAPPATGAVFVHDASAPFLAVISDIDDTVVNTHVTSKRKLASTVLLKNAAQLEPVPGAARNYDEAGRAGVSAFFYLSGSPQNLYPRLRSFLDANAFPRGPLLLKNLGEDALLKQQGYKGARIDELFARYPNMRAILVGDSGEKDPEIYLAARQQHGERVAAIVIRKAAGAANHAERFTGITVVDGSYPRDTLIAELARSAHSASATDGGTP